MITFGWILFVGGLSVALFAFIGAAKNMGNMVSGGQSFDSGFKSHLGKMVPMAISGVVSSIGVVLLIIGYISKFAG